jgi:hypothetical protein
MTSRTHHRLSVAGFSLLYAASMGSLALLCTPYFDGLETELLLYGALPAAIAGIGIIAFEKMHPPTYRLIMKLALILAGLLATTGMVYAACTLC